MRTARSSHPDLPLEILEARIAPAALINNEGTLVYTAGAGVSNDLSMTIVGTNLVITDNAETITATGSGFTLSNNNHTATGPLTSVATISLMMNDGTDAVGVFATDDQLNISGTGVLNVTVGAGTVKSIKNLVSIEATGAGTDTLSINASSDSAAATVSISSGGIGSQPGDNYFGANGAVLLSGLETITVRTGSASDTVRVLSTATGSSTTLISSGGTDQVTVGEAGSVQAISGAFAIGNVGTSSNLTLDNSADTVGRTIVVTQTQVTGLAPATISFSEAQVNNFTVLAGTGPDTITINSVQQGSATANVIEGGGGADIFTLNTNDTSVTLRGGAGIDAFTIGTGNLNSNTGAIVVEGGGQIGDQLTLNDATIGTASTFTINATTIDRGTFGGVNYSGLLAVALNTGAGANTFNIRALPAGVGLTIGSADGDDSFNLGSSGGLLDPLQGFLILNGSDASDTIRLTDSGSTGNHKLVIGGVSILRDGVALVTSFTSVENIIVTGGSGDDFIDLRDAPVGAIVDAGNGNDTIVGSKFLDIVTGGGGRDTFALLGLSGDATVADSGVTSTGGGSDVFADPIEIVKVTGDAGVNVFDATSYTGFALLDGVSGADTITGSEVTFAAKSVVFTDRDGGTVTLKTTKGRLDSSTVNFLPIGSTAQLVGLDLAGRTEFKGASVSITETRGALGGDSFVNVGLIDATGVDLAAVNVAGDLGRILAGDTTLTTPGLGTLTVRSLGGLGTFTQGNTGDTLTVIAGKLGTLNVKGSLRGDVTANDIGTLVVQSELAGSVVATTGGIATATIRGTLSGGLEAGGVLGTVKVLGDLRGTIAAGTAADFAPTTQARSVVLKALSVSGDVRNASILAGARTLSGVFNADVSIGTIAVTGDWVESNVAAGVSVSVGAFGAVNDTLGVGKGGAFDGVSGGNTAITARIASITLKGQALGTGNNPADHFSFVAQQIGAFKLGAAKLSLTTGSDPDFAVGGTGDITVREV